MTIAARSSTFASDATDAFARRHLRHNLLALGMDFGFFMVALSFAGQATILPAFAAHLGAPNVVIGAIPALMTVGWYLPPLFVAGYTQSLAQKLPFIVRYTLWERAPYLILAVAAFTLAVPAPGLTLVLLLAMLLVIAATGGVLMPAWMDVVAGAIPTTLRGRFFAFGYDAFRIAASLQRGAGVNPEGLTGTLTIDAQGRVRRELEWARIRNGAPTPLERADTTAATPP